MKNKKMIFAVVLLVLLSAAVFWLKGCLTIDRCLDSGGRWNAEANQCEH